MLTIGCFLAAVVAEPSVAYLRPGRTEIVSKTIEPCLTPALGESQSPSVSATGRYVAFESSNPCMVFPDATAPESLLQDIYVTDRGLGEIELVSISSDGIQGIGRSSLPDISSSGRYIAFVSVAPNLVPGDTNLAPDVFLRDLRHGLTERISLDSDGEEVANPGVKGADRGGSVSDDGRYVTFSSTASGLVADDTNGVEDVFVRDRKKDVTRRVSLAADGSQGNAESTGNFISGNGRYVTFASTASNLVADDTNAFPDAFVKDLRSGDVERVSVASDGSQGMLGGGGPAGISDDGRFVLVISQARNLVPMDTYFGGTNADAFVYDRATERMRRVSVTSYGEEGTDGAVIGGGAISANGRVVSFGTSANNLACCDDTGSSTPLLPLTGDNDVVTHEFASGATEYVSIGYEGGESTECPGTAGAASASSLEPSVSRDGRFVAFHSCTENLEPGDSGEDWDVFLRDRGAPLGTGEIAAGGQDRDEGICVGDRCVLPGGSVSSSDPTDDLNSGLTRLGANLFGSSIVYRPQYGDLFVAIELEYMGPVVPGSSPISYGIQFGVADKDYEVRATSLLGGTFGLFDCSDPRRCTKIADLRGGYGTTGMRVVLSVPLVEVGLSNGGVLEGIRAYSALGTEQQAAQILDTLRFR